MDSLNTVPCIHRIKLGSRWKLLSTLLTVMLVAVAIQAANPGVLPPQSPPYGKSYAEWSAAWWQWFLERPLTVPDPNLDYDIVPGKVGNVWFLASGLPNPAIDIPASTALFIPLMNVECSSLEPPESGFHGDTEAEQAECAKYWADHIINTVCIIDGRTMAINENYRVTSPQFSFDAPTPWVFGDIGGSGTSVSDGYYVMVAPLSVGVHTITIKATLHFKAGEIGPDPVDALQTDVTWHITVVPPSQLLD